MSEETGGGQTLNWEQANTVEGAIRELDWLLRGALDSIGQGYTQALHDGNVPAQERFETIQSLLDTYRTRRDEVLRTLYPSKERN